MRIKKNPKQALAMVRETELPSRRHFATPGDSKKIVDMLRIPEYRKLIHTFIGSPHLGIIALHV